MIIEALAAATVACGTPDCGPPVVVVRPTTTVTPPPRIVEVRPRVIVKPRQTIVVRRPPQVIYSHRHGGCWQYHCKGPRTAFRMPDEVPYAYYEQQFVPQYGPPTNYDETILDQN